MNTLPVQLAEAYVAERRSQAETLHTRRRLAAELRLTRRRNNNPISGIV